MMQHAVKTLCRSWRLGPKGLPVVAATALLVACGDTPAVTAPNLDPPPDLIFSDPSSSQANIPVCHLDDSGQFALFYIAQQALQAHLDHGDGQPGDAVPGREGYIFDEACAAILEILEGTTKIRADIDGLSRIVLRSSTAQWQHFLDAAPGRLLGRDNPTIINGVNWFPTWDDVPTAENRSCGGCLSSIFAGVAPPLPDRAYAVNLNYISGRSPSRVSIVEFPSAGNGYATVVEINDNGVCCTAWYEFELVWSTAS